jgi:enhancing lycopene biosynthesis protein 2
MSAVSSKVSGQNKVALILAGCGARDGAEITEAVSLLIELSREGYVVQCFASDRDTHHVVDHLTGKDVSTETRNQLTEAARIARGHVKPLQQLKVADFDAVVLAGGFGVANNLCNFAQAGAEAQLFDDVRAALLPFLQNGKVAAALCIAPVVLALLAREAGLRGVELTLGSGDALDAVRSIESWGAVHKPTRPGEACVDSVHRMASAPAYMYDDATPADVFASAQALVKGIGTLIKGASRDSKP